MGEDLFLPWNPIGKTGRMVLNILLSRSLQVFIMPSSSLAKIPLEMRESEQIGRVGG